MNVGKFLFFMFYVEFETNLTSGMVVLDENDAVSSEEDQSKEERISGDYGKTFVLSGGLNDLWKKPVRTPPSQVPLFRREKVIKYDKNGDISFYGK